MSNQFCAMVNDIITWRQGLGDAITMNDYIDFGIPQTEADLIRITNAVNDSFKSFGQAMRVGYHQGTIVPKVDDGKVGVSSALRLVGGNNA